MSIDQSAGRGLAGSTLLPRGARLIISTPQPIAALVTPAWMSAAARCTACWLDPHWQSIVVTPVSSGRPA